jgi:hypothetical protein
VCRRTEARGRSHEPGKEGALCTPVSILFWCLLRYPVKNGLLALAKQELYPLSHTASPFCSGYLGDGSHKLSWLTSNRSQPPK